MGENGTAMRNTLTSRLAASLPGPPAQLRMAPRPRPDLPPSLNVEHLREAAALLLLYEHCGEWHIPLTVRASRLRQHTSQVSLPGGRLEAGETPEAAALREASEEIGVPASEVRVLGRLTPLPIAVSLHLLHPIVGLVDRRPQFLIAASEVERLIEVPLSQLRDPGAIRWETRQRTLPPAGPMEVPYFDMAGAHVWGATAMVLAEFLDVINDLPLQT